VNDRGMRNIGWLDGVYYTRYFRMNPSNFLKAKETLNKWKKIEMVNEMVLLLSIG